MQATARALTKRSNSITDEFIRCFFSDVHLYLKRRDLRKQANSLVGKALDGKDPVVIVAHSLGTVVAYWTLKELKRDISVPLLVTLGSPLGIPSIKSEIPRPLDTPPAVRHWLNAADVRDPIALFPRLDRNHYPEARIENISDVKNPPGDRHGIRGYLRDDLVVRRIAEAISSNGPL